MWFEWLPGHPPVYGRTTKARCRPARRLRVPRGRGTTAVGDGGKLVRSLARLSVYRPPSVRRQVWRAPDFLVERQIYGLPYIDID